MLRKKTNPKKPISPWTFRPSAAVVAAWAQIESAHSNLNASQIINDSILLHGTEAARLFLLQEKAKIDATLTMLAARATEKAKPQRPAEAMASNGASGDAMKAIEVP